jgi:hypothetical protein
LPTVWRRDINCRSRASQSIPRNLELGLFKPVRSDNEDARFSKVRHGTPCFASVSLNAR